MIEEVSWKDESDGDNMLFDIKEHVVQLEGITLAIILFMAILYITFYLGAVQRIEAAFYLPFLFLMTIPLFVRVTNPPSRLRDFISGGLAGLGGGATAGGAIGSGFFGIGAPIGAAIGAGAGFIVGGITGLVVWRLPKTLTQGEARKLLIDQQKHHPDLPIEAIIYATKYPSDPDRCATYRGQLLWGARRWRENPSMSYAALKAALFALLAKLARTVRGNRFPRPVAWWDCIDVRAELDVE